MILYKDKEYYDTYDLGKLNSYAESGEVIKRMFSHKFLEIFRMCSFGIQFAAISWGYSWSLGAAMFIPVGVRGMLEQYQKKLGHISWWRNYKLNQDKHQIVAESISNIKLVKDFSVEEKKFNEVKELNKKIMRNELDF